MRSACVAASFCTFILSSASFASLPTKNFATISPDRTSGDVIQDSRTPARRSKLPGEDMIPMKTVSGRGASWPVGCSSSTALEVRFCNDSALASGRWKTLAGGTTGTILSTSLTLVGSKPRSRTPCACASVSACMVGPACVTGLAPSSTAGRL
eukprot:scaffold324_cov394-Prasinococcus_capsulatus_cf.AAC.25